jgi:RNA polymerase sigma factor (sigma-70 family)
METVRKDDVDVVTLVDRAVRGDQLAWRHIVSRYESLVLSTCRRFGIAGTDADDVSGNVWVRLVAHLRTIREPAALPGWLKTTAQHECLSLLRAKGRELPSEGVDVVEPGAPYSGLLLAERRAALRKALARLSTRDQKLLALLFSAPPSSYERISAVLGMPVGAIGPTRQRCLARLRNSPELVGRQEKS